MLALMVPAGIGQGELLETGLHRPRGLLLLFGERADDGQLIAHLLGGAPEGGLGQRERGLAEQPEELLWAEAADAMAAKQAAQARQRQATGLGSRRGCALM